MRQQGAALAQVCPLCRGDMPDVRRLMCGGWSLNAQFDRWMDANNPYLKSQGTVTVQPPAWARQLLAEASNLCEEVKAIDPEHGDVGFLHGNVLSSSDDIDGAIREYRNAIRINPSNRNVAPAQCLIGAHLYRRGDLDGAEKAYRASISADPKRAQAHYNLGNVMMARNEMEGAMMSFRAATGADPCHAESHYNIAIILQSQKDYDAMLVVLRKAIAFVPDSAMVQNLLGLHLHGTFKDNDGAEAAFRAAIAADPNFTDAHRRLGMLLLDERNDLAGAERAIRTAIETGPSDGHSHCSMGVLLQAQEDNISAEAAFRQARALTHSEDAHVLYELGWHLQFGFKDKRTRRANSEEAEAVLREAVAVDAKHSFAHFTIGCLLRDFRHDLTGAVAAFRTAVATDPKNVNAWNSLGSALFDLEKFDDAAQAFEALLAVAPDHKSGQSNLTLARKWACSEG
jgi:tetratricopeptide (TPR) repeat protein